jgi:hypothetical protein
MVTRTRPRSRSGRDLVATGNGEVHVSVIVPGGAAHTSGLQKDVIESIDGQRMRPSRGVEQLSICETCGAKALVARSFEGGQNDGLEHRRW